MKDRKSDRKNLVSCGPKHTVTSSIYRKKRPKLADLDTDIHHQKVLICNYICTSLLSLCREHSRYIDVDRSCTRPFLVEVKVDCN